MRWEYRGSGGGLYVMKVGVGEWVGVREVGGS